MFRLILGAVVIYFVFWFLNRIMHPSRRRNRPPVGGSNGPKRTAVDADFEELDDR